MAVPLGRCSEWITSPRRVRVLFGNETIAASGEMMLLRQHGFLPVYYFPERHVRTDLLEDSSHTTFSPYKGVASYFDVRVNGEVARASAWTYREPLPGSPDTRGYMSFHWHGMEAWVEEDEMVFVHARDPYLRAETLASSQHVVVRLGGDVVADTVRPVLLLETGLVPRYYVPSVDVDRRFFRHSTTYSKCPYKGTALYLSYRRGRVRIDDAAWYYRSPLRDVMKIAGHVCFWNERPDTTIEVDGRVLAHLGVRRSGAGGELLYPSRRLFAVPPPLTMAGAEPGQLQHDFARPNGRPEGPPDDLIEMDVERAGGRRPSFVGDIAEPDDGGSRLDARDSPGTGTAPPGAGEKSSLFFTFGRSRPDGPAAPSVADDPGAGAPAAFLCERALRRVRAVVAGITVADSREAVLYDGVDALRYYFPAEHVRQDLLAGAGLEAAAAGLGPVSRYLVRMEAPLPGRTAAFSPLDPPPGLEVLRGRIAFEWDGVGEWFEEDDEVRGEPRQPYHRVDAIHSGRHVVVALADELLAESRRSVAVFETDQPARFYLPRLDAAMGLLSPSGRSTESPYLGTARYLSASVAGRVHTDVAWTYSFPIPECPKIAGLVCFDESRVDVKADGLPLPS